MNKNRLLYLILALVIIPSVILLVFSAANRKGQDTDSVTDPAEAPASLEQVVEEFNEELGEEGEPVDPETFSDYTEDYEIEVQEDEVVNIN